MPSAKEVREKIFKTRKEVENNVGKIIINTDFYNRYKESIFEWYYNYPEELLLIFGGYGIGKSRTLKQILESENISYLLFSKIRLEYENQILNKEYDNKDIIVFDDAFISKRVEHFIFNLIDKNIRSIFIVNSFDELNNLRKILGRLKLIYLDLNNKDVEYMKNKLSEIYKINYDNYVILNLRDLVNITTYEITKDINKYKPKLLIEEIIEDIKSINNRKELLKQILDKIRSYGLNINIDMATEIAIKVLGYSPTTAKKYIKFIINEI
ncbi:MAG: hypothetical protein ACP5GJ_03945 [Nanopusillaceae archaeon]